jgi:hypothetical protein
VSESEVLRFFNIEYQEIGHVVKHYEGQKACDREYYAMSELHFMYWVSQIAIEKGMIQEIII